MGFGGVSTQAAAFVFFVGLEVTFEPLHVAVAFERENMRGQAIQEPAIMADDHGAAGEFGQRFFQRAQCVHVQIVRGLIEQNDVAFAFQHFRQMHAVALTT